MYRVWSFLGITFDAHPHSGWFFCLAPNGARRTNSHIIKLFDRLSQGESGIRLSRLGVKCGYATIAGGLITTLFSPRNGLGIMAIGGISVLSNLYHIKRIEAKLKK